MTGIRRFDRDKDRRIIAVAAPPPPPIALPSSKLSRDDLELHSWYDCFDEREPQQTLAGGVIKGDRVFLSSKPNMGKTWIAQWLAFQMALGKKFVRGDESPDPCRVWWMDLEMGRNQFLGRFEMIARGMWPMGNYPKRDELGLFYDTGKRVNLDDDAGAIRLLDFLRRSQIDVMFIDSYAKITAGRENEKVDMQPVMDRISHIHTAMTADRGIPFTSVVIAHEPKSGEGGVAGSRVMEAEPDALILLRAGEGNLDRTLKTKKMRNGPGYEIDYTMNWGEDRAGRPAFWVSDAEDATGDKVSVAAQAAKPSPLRDALMDMLRNGRAMTATDIKRRAELEGKNIFPAQLKKYVDDGTLAFDAASKLYKLA
jgi:predicted ATP-dependent serine protease